MRAHANDDLLGRVLRTLDFARAAANAVLSDTWSSEIPLPREKFVAETALLLYIVAPLAPLHDLISAHIRAIATQIAPFARSEEVCGAICLDPGQALDHACAHVLLSAIGYCDSGVDALLRNSVDAEVAPERLPHRLLEQRWLKALNNGRSAPADATLIAGSMLARQLDALSSTRFDFYGFTHAIMYASDFGASPPPLTYRAMATANAVAGLAFAISERDYDLAAELLMTWPMLRIPCEPSATIAFEWLVEAQDEHGFLPGKSFDSSSYDALCGSRKEAHLFATSYHTMYVMAFLCACRLRFDPALPKPAGCSTELQFLSALESRSASDRYAGGLTALHEGEHPKLIGPLLITIALREAARAGNIAGLRGALQFALDNDLTDVLAVGQAADFLRRAAHLDRLYQPRL